MFDSLQTRLGTVFDRLRGRGALSEADVETALGEVRSVLIDADVALPVVKNFIGKVRERAVGESVIRSVTPGQQVVKIVYDTLVETLGAESGGLSLGAPPAPILMVGLQGSGRNDIGQAREPASNQRQEAGADGLARRQPPCHGAAQGAGRAGQMPTHPIVLGQRPTEIAKRPRCGASGTMLILDTAGRQHVDEALMAEIAEVKSSLSRTKPCWLQTSLTGQDAVNIAKSFNDRADLRHHPDTNGRRPARRRTLSMREVTGADRSLAPAKN
jgi:signal recognition particle subunit SRP54